MSFGAAGSVGDAPHEWNAAQHVSGSTTPDLTSYRRGESSRAPAGRTQESASGSTESVTQRTYMMKGSDAGTTPILVVGRHPSAQQMPVQHAGNAPRSSPLFDCVNPIGTTPLSIHSTEAESPYFRSTSGPRQQIVVAQEKQLPSLPPDEAGDDGMLDSSFDSRFTSHSASHSDRSARRHKPVEVPGYSHDRTNRSPEQALLNGNDAAALRSRLSPSWNAAKNAFAKSTKSKKNGSAGSTSPAMTDNKDLIGLGVRSGEAADVTHGSQNWADRAGAMGQSAGLGLKKWGKASAAKLKQAQQLSKDGSPLLGGWARGGGGALRRYDGRAAKSAADLTTSSDAEFAPPLPLLPAATPDPRIGLPTDVRHNVHVDVGPQGYTGLPMSWANVLAQYGMNAEDVRRDPESALEVIRERTQYFVDKEAERGQDPEHTKKVLESRLGHLEDMQEAREAVRSVTPGPMRSRHSVDNVTRSDGTIKRGSNASTTYSSVLHQGWPASPTWSDAPSLPKLQIKDMGPSPVLPSVDHSSDEEDWGASLLRALPKSSSASSRLSDRRRSRSLELLPSSYTIQPHEPPVAEDLYQNHLRESYGAVKLDEDTTDDQEEMAEDLEIASIQTASKVSAIKITRSSISSSSLTQDSASVLRLVDRRTSGGSSSQRHQDYSEARSSSIASRSASPSNDDSGVRSVQSIATAASSASNYQINGLSTTTTVNARPPSASSSATSELSAHVMNGLRERRKQSPRIYPPSSSRFVGKDDAPSPRSVGFKQTTANSTSATQASLHRQSNASTQLSDNSHSIDRLGGDSPVLERQRGATPELRKPDGLQEAVRNSGASVRLASAPLQTFLRTDLRGSSQASGDQDSIHTTRNLTLPSGQATPDLILPNADGFFRPSSAAATSPLSYSPTSDRQASLSKSTSAADHVLVSSPMAWHKADVDDRGEETGRKADDSLDLSEADEDYQQTSDFLDDWINGEEGSDEEEERKEDGSIAPTVSSSTETRRRDMKRAPAPLRSIGTSTHQSPSPALLLGLPTPLRTQFEASIHTPTSVASLPSAPVPVAGAYSSNPAATEASFLAPVKSDRTERDWRARSLPPPPEDDVGPLPLAFETDPSHDESPNTGRMSPVHVVEEAVVTRASSRASRTSSRAGRRSMRRRSSDARRFPVSMHYASGFDADALNADPEAISSFAELMRSRQSMDLDDVMPVHMSGNGADVPPVPSLPNPANSLAHGQIHHAAQARTTQFDIRDLPVNVQSLQPFLRTEQPKDVFGDLVLIGEGDAGNVYSTIPRADCMIPSISGRGKVAIKIVRLHPDLAEDEDQRRAREMRLALLDRELTLWREGGRHPNIVALHDVFLSRSAANAIYIVQEFMSISLADVITLKDAGLTIEEAHISRIANDVCQALKHLHHCTIIHRDVRSDNILLTFDGKAKLGDFTHATSIVSSKRTSVVGTAYWMAPEVIKADMYDTQADMWSLGAVLYEMAEGDPPRVELPALQAISMTTTLGMPPLSDPMRWSNTFKKCLAWCTQMSSEDRATAQQLLYDPFVASATSYQPLADLVELARTLEADALDAADEEEIVEEEHSPSPGPPRPASKDVRDSWTSQTTVHA